MKTFTSPQSRKDALKTSMRGGSMSRAWGLLAFVLLFASSSQASLIERTPASKEDLAKIARAARTGVINGGGGKGVLCQSARRVEALDIYEARSLYGLQALPVPASEGEAFQLGVELLARHMWNAWTIPMDDYVRSLREYIHQNFLKRVRFLSYGQHLKPVNDAYEPIVEAGCETVQAAVMYDESLILIDQTYWDMMDNLNRAALIYHEIMYYVARLEGGEKDSIATRKLIGMLFSKNPPRPRADGVPTDQKDFIHCHMIRAPQNISFFAYNIVFDGRPAVELVSTGGLFDGRSNLFRASVRLIDTSIEELSKGTSHRRHYSMPIEVDTYLSRQFMEIEFDEGQYLGKVRFLSSLGADIGGGVYDMRCR